MKGSIKKDKKTGKYFYVIDMGIDPLTGKRTQKKKRGFNTKKEAEHALSEFLNMVTYKKSPCSIKAGLFFV